MTIKQFNEQDNILFIVYYRTENYHTVQFDIKKSKPDEINQGVKNITYNGGLTNNDFNSLLNGKTRIEAINEMIILLLNKSNFFSEPIDKNNFQNININFIDSAKLN